MSYSNLFSQSNIIYGPKAEFKHFYYCVFVEITFYSGAQKREYYFQV